jgi:hypothetical protein
VCDRYLSGKSILLTVLMVAAAAVLLMLYTLLPVTDSIMLPRLLLNGSIGLCVSGGDYALTTVVVQVCIHHTPHTTHHTLYTIHGLSTTLHSLSTTLHSLSSSPLPFCRRSPCAPAMAFVLLVPYAVLYMA